MCVFFIRLENGKWSTVCAVSPETNDTVYICASLFVPLISLAVMIGFSGSS